MGPPTIEPPTIDPSLQISLEKIRALFAAPDDTSRFVGFALLKSVLDNAAPSPAPILAELWEAVPVPFLDRLIRTGVLARRPQHRDMLDLAASVLHAFAVGVSDEQRQAPRLVERIPRLVDALLHSSDSTAGLILETLAPFVGLPAGANAFIRLEDVSPLIEVAPRQPAALDVLYSAWLRAGATAEVDAMLRTRIDEGIQGLTLVFKGTDSVILLEFVAKLFRHLDPTFLPPSPRWLGPLVSLLHALPAKRPTPEARHAYITAAAAILQAYPARAPALIFSPASTSDKPASYLLLSLLLIDIRSSAPTLLESLNAPSYPAVSLRLAAGFDVVSGFVGYLVRCAEDDDDGRDAALPLPMPPDLLLKLRKEVGETMSLTIEYLRDRWDSAHAGAMGLHPDARPGAAHAATGTAHLPLTWDSVAGQTVEEDPLILAALRALALWLREDDSSLLRREAAGLADMFLELYESSCRPAGGAKTLDFRSPILTVLEVICQEDDGIELLLRQDGWKILVSDLTAILRLTSTASDETEASRGTDIVRVLLPIAEGTSSTAEEWMGLVTAVAGWDCPDPTGEEAPEAVTELQLAALQLACALVANASPGMRSRYTHSVAAARGVAVVLGRRIGTRSPLRAGIDDVVRALADL